MNYYDVLRVAKNASAQEIKDSYKKLIKRYHPDLYPGNKVRAESITRDLNEAYEVLSDLEKRELYDLSLKEPIIVYREPEQTSINYSSQKYSQTSMEDEPQDSNFEERLRKNIHSFVENQSKKISPNSKNAVVLVIIFFTLIILLLTVKDYIDFQYSIQERKVQEQKYQNFTNNI